MQAWKTRIDSQPVFSHYKAVTYMCAYFSKAENETSEAMSGHFRKDRVRENESRCKILLQKVGVLSPRASVPTNARIVAQENIS